LNWQWKTGLKNYKDPSRCWGDYAHTQCLIGWHGLIYSFRCVRRRGINRCFRVPSLVVRLRHESLAIVWMDYLRNSKCVKDFLSQEFDYRSNRGLLHCLQKHEFRELQRQRLSHPLTLGIFPRNRYKNLWNGRYVTVSSPMPGRGLLLMDFVSAHILQSLTNLRTWATIPGRWPRRYQGDHDSLPNGKVGRPTGTVCRSIKESWQDLIDCW